jgi:hypothetical protein
MTPHSLVIHKSDRMLPSATILNNLLRPRLTEIVTPEQLKAIADSVSAINDLSPDQQYAVRAAFAEGYNRQNIFMAAMSALGLVSSLFLWERHPRKGWR